jgi:hypothetical protein
MSGILQTTLEGDIGNALGLVREDGTIEPVIVLDPAALGLPPGDRDNAPLTYDTGTAAWQQCPAETAISCNGIVGSGFSTMVIGTDNANMSIIGANGATGNLISFEGVDFKTLGGGFVFSWATAGPSVALSFNGETPIVRPTVTGSRGGNAALASLLTALNDVGLITDGTSA